MQFSESRRISARLHRLIPGGCHTYAKGDDQFPWCSPAAIVRGQGCHVWDVDGNEFIEYGMGCRAVTLGHAFPPVVEAVQRELLRGVSFTRPARVELECAETLCGMIPAAEMVKFAKDGSSVTTAAVKLARAHTGRDMIALCGDHPFFAVHDWFIGTTGISAGIPQSVRELSVTFRYNDLDSLRYLFRRHPGRIACVILEPAKHEEPADRFLHRVQELCQAHGALFVLDEMITGFRWDNGGAQQTYGIEPDLAAFGKGLANGFSVSALVGKRRYMEVGGLYHDRERVFLLSTTHGAETHALAAAVATMRVYQQEPVIETLYRRGRQLEAGLRQLIDRHDVRGHVAVVGRPCNLVFTTRDAAGEPSQGMRALLMQELIRRGVLGPSLVVSYAHTEADIDRTLAAFDGALPVYRRALSEGYERYLVGPPTQHVYQPYNEPWFRTPYASGTGHPAPSAGPGQLAPVEPISPTAASRAT